MNLQFLEVLGNELAVVWDDGHESYYPLGELRRNCPCAVCAGEPDLFGRVARPPKAPLSPAAFEAHGVERVGNYGLVVRWGDGHSFGIWTLDRLRAACPCQDCRS
ncbi:MAG: DUF971 domain-containing protein [Thermoanaerobaculia bacterium]